MVSECEKVLGKCVFCVRDVECVVDVSGEVVFSDCTDRASPQSKNSCEACGLSCHCRTPRSGEYATPSLSSPPQIQAASQSPLLTLPRDTLNLHQQLLPPQPLHRLPLPPFHPALPLRRPRSPIHRRLRDPLRRKTTLPLRRHNYPRRPV